MRRLAWLGSIALFAATAHAGILDPNLERVLDTTAPGDAVPALVYLGEQLDVGALTAEFDAQRASRRQRHEAVVQELQDLAAMGQAELIAYLNERKAAGTVSEFRAFWVANVVHVVATPAEIRAITDRAGVDYVYFDYPIELIEPVDVKFDGRGPLAGGPEPGIVAVRTPEVWEMGITGAGVLTATLDTGVDGNHPALASRWRGLDSRYADNPEWAWFDPVTNTTFPTAFGSHGTHTMGSVLGGAPGDQVGVAPGAEWTHAATIDRQGGDTVSDSLLAFEWLVDPDGDPKTSWDVPHVCSNSWGVLGHPACDETFWQHLDNCEAAGMVILFGAGNEGEQGLRRPADRATDEYRTFAVGAVDANDPDLPIAGFSSRGPTNCTPDGSRATKPEIVAPGVHVRTATPGGGYSYSGGTSMAAPHVNGVVCLMLEANADLTVEEIKQIIYDTAFDLGDPGNDNAYGWGMVDAFAAVQEALGLTPIAFSFPGGRPRFIDPFGGTRIRVEVNARAEEPGPGTGMVYYRADGGDFTVESMEEIEPNVYDAVFPAFPCGALVEYYFSAETMGGERIFSPCTAPDRKYSAEAYTGIATTFADDFETDQGWTVVSDEGLTDGEWERGIPQGGPGAPDEDSDGSGQCYVTKLEPGRDVDGWYARLTSPVMDASSEDATIAFDWWFSADDNDFIIVEASDDDGANWRNVTYIRGADGGEYWIHEAISVSSITGIEHTDQFRLRLRVRDNNEDSTVEAGIDAVQMQSGLVCEADCTADLDGDGNVGFGDLLRMLAAWGPCEACPEDLDGDNVVGFLDLLALLTAWGVCP